MKKGFNFLALTSKELMVHILSNKIIELIGFSSDLLRATSVDNTSLETRTPEHNSLLGIVNPRSGVTLAFAHSKEE